MLRLHNVRFGWMLLLILGLWSVAAHAEPFRHDNYRHNEKLQYRYVSLQEFLPPGYDRFRPVAIDDRGRVYGTVRDINFVSHIGVYADGVVTVFQPGYASVANEKGTVGGFVLNNPETFETQAALFHGDQLERILFRDGEIGSEVVALNDRGAALVLSYSEDSVFYSLYRKGQSRLLNLDPDISRPTINNKGIIAGTTYVPSVGIRGIRFDTDTGVTTLLNPLPTDEYAYARGVNNRGEVLGYSFSSSVERIGVWDRKGIFKTYFVEGIPEIPTISDFLLFNDKNLIVITDILRPADEKGNSYLIPKPGVRLNLADLVEPPLLDKKLDSIRDINNHGSMIGIGTDRFLLERIRSRHH